MLKTVSSGWTTEGFLTPKDNFFDYIFVAKHLEMILKGIREGKDVPEYFDKRVGLCGNFQKVGEALGTKELNNLEDSFLPDSFMAMGLDPVFPLGYDEEATDMYKGRRLQKRIALLGGLLDLWERLVLGGEKAPFIETIINNNMDQVLGFWEEMGLRVDYHQLLPSDKEITLKIVFKR